MQREQVQVGRDAREREGNMTTWWEIVGIALVVSVFLTLITWGALSCRIPDDEIIGNQWVKKVTVKGHEYMISEKFMLHSESCPCKKEAK